MSRTAKQRFWLALSPPADVSKKDTSLRFTDILFGFVIREIFLRVQNWNDLSGPVRWQLVCSSALVLGSWIGFRRSIHRSDYEPKFFNLPLIRFVLDQLMIILYFRVSVAVPTDASAALPSPTELAVNTAWNLSLVFALYVLWDVLGIWMARAGDHASNPAGIKYPKIEDDAPGTSRQPVNGWGFFITGLAFVVLLIVWKVADARDVLSADGSMFCLGVCTVVLVLYRFAKEVRTSWRT